MDENFDVVVVGGGTAGVLAAVAAAEEGARTLLIEEDTAIGGVGVRAGIHLYYVGSKGGAQDGIDRRTRALHREFGGKARGFHPEAKLVADDERLRTAGVSVLLSSQVVAVDLEGGSIVALVVETETRRLHIGSGVTVDATGGGDVAALAGAEFEVGREWDGAQHTYSLVPRYFEEDRGVLHYKNYDVGWVDSTDVRDVSRGYRDGRRFAWRHGETPASDHYLALGPQLGVREGRRVLGEYVLTHDDLVLDRHFDDLVLRCYSHHDTHTLDYANESDDAQTWIPVLAQRMTRYAAGVPYRALVPRRIDGLLIGCRALSQSHDASMHLRMQRDIQKVGEVAGVAAALATRTGHRPRDVDLSVLQGTLVRRGVIKEADLAREPAPILQLPTGSVALPPGPGDEAAAIGALVDLLGTPDEHLALWWLPRLGSSAADALFSVLGRDENRARRRGAALALGLSRDARAVPELLTVIERGDRDRPSDDLDLDRAEERWLAALIVLRMLRDPGAVPVIVARVGVESSSTTLLYCLRYLLAVAPSLDAGERERVRDLAHAVLDREDLGADFFVQGSHDASGTRSDASSMRWGLELTTAALLAAVGSTSEADEVLRRCSADPRGYVRVGADRLRARTGSGAHHE